MLVHGGAPAGLYGPLLTNSFGQTGASCPQRHHGCTMQLVFQQYCEVDGVAGMALLVHVDQAVLCTQWAPHLSYVLFGDLHAFLLRGMQLLDRLVV